MYITNAQKITDITEMLHIRDKNYFTYAAVC